jgi:cellobiose phosphorylase
MKFETKYGYFSDDGNEYVIKTYNTPKPWINVVSNGEYGLVISQAGGGFSWLTHSEFNRLNRWHQDLIQDNWGKYFYIKNNDTNEFWSPTWMPVKSELDYYLVRYGFGYSRFESEYKNIRTILTVFVPLDEQVEIWNFSFENKTDSKVSLSVYSYFEWCLGSSADHHREFHKAFLETAFISELNCMTATKRLWEIPIENRGHWNIKYPYYGFISCSNKITDYDADKESFIGKFGSLEKPQGVLSESLNRKIGKWSDSIGTVKTEIQIGASGQKDMHFIIGIKSNRQEISKSIKKFNSAQSINNSLNNVKKFWIELFDVSKVQTPDESINLLVNKWLRYQSISGRLWARTAYYQQSGAFGFRDQLQDSLIFLTIKPSLTLKQIRLHARHQLRDGTVLHWWHPITETGLQTKITDDLLWLPFVLIQYLKETGDYKSLNIKEPYYDDLNEKDSLFNHSVAAIERVLKRLSKRGLPLIGAGDWNDGLSAAGLDMKGESIWLAEFLYLVLKEFSGICKTYGEQKLSQRYIRKADKLKETFDRYAWDGKWFYRAVRDDGKKIGSKTNAQGKIYLNAQSWAVISGISEPDKNKKAIDTVTKLLLHKNGPLLLYPAYTKPDKMIGYLSRYAPGRRENGGVYTHAAAWLIWAYASLKENELCFETYKRISPPYNSISTDNYSAEPYVSPGNIDGPDSPDYGMGGWTWYTGSAAWLQKVVIDYMLGIRATEFGLMVDPCIPDEWERYFVTRMFRNTFYNISIINDHGLTKRIKCIEVDGNKIEGNIIGIQNKERIEVKVYLG